MITYKDCSKCYFRIDCLSGRLLECLADMIGDKTSNNCNTYQQAIDTFGKDHQLRVAEKEALSLAKSLLDYQLSGNLGASRLLEAIADMEIMINQLRLIFNSTDIDQWKSKKLKYLEELIKVKNNESTNSL